jgi:septum formation protein
LNNFILASKSPRRVDLLKSINLIPKKIYPANIGEFFKTREKPKDYCKRISLEKARFVQLKFPNDIILSADTIVFTKGKIFGKPKDKNEAKTMLNFFSGKNHFVCTAVTLLFKEKLKFRIVTSKVKFKNLDMDDIDCYIKTNEWKDKAGAYGIQGYAERFVKRISGSYSNIVGLPLFETFGLLKSFNIKDF